MITITKEFTFDAAHRLFGYEGKCFNLHGHSWKVLITVVSSHPLNNLGMVIDFKNLKEIFQKWLDNNWDHATILNDLDTDVIEFCGLMGFKCFKVKGNPTAENMANFLLESFNLFLPAGFYVEQVVVYETEKNFVTAKLVR